ncbi:SRPBCC family protein [Bdellovibrio sp. HCB274]|uniref:SRPBCC family protein n=1 Tax=Bdellovibrio sp. HCB274 TaxID=3394361 RepID=UPI0039B504C2
MAPENIQNPNITSDKNRTARTSSSTTPSHHQEGKLPISNTIYKKSPDEVFQVLRNVENLPAFFENLYKTEVVSAAQTKWIFRDHSLAEDSEDLTMMMSSQLNQESHTLLWRSEDGAGFDYSIRVELAAAPGNRGTIVRMNVDYDNITGDFIGKFEKLFGKDAVILSKKALFRLKAFCETGDVPTTFGQPSGRDEDMPEKTH